MSAADSAVPPAISRRLLEMLIYLAKHQPKVARDIVHTMVPSPASLARAAAAAADKKGKGKAVEMPPEEPDEKALEVLLETLGKPLCRRSGHHLEQVRLGHWHIQMVPY